MIFLTLLAARAITGLVTARILQRDPMAGRLRLPGLVLFLALGIAIGSDGTEPDRRSGSRLPWPIR
jgi:NhaP-type Na+/H+ and K+/H+ antiporter